MIFFVDDIDCVVFIVAFAMTVTNYQLCFNADTLSLIYAERGYRILSGIELNTVNYDLINKNFEYSYGFYINADFNLF